MLHQHSSTISRNPSLHKKSSASSLASNASLSSIIHRPSPRPIPFTHSFTHPNPPITDAHLIYLTNLLPSVRPSAAIQRHIHDIPTFLRLHRHVAGGVSAVATRHLNLVASILAILQLPHPADKSAVRADDPAQILLGKEDKGRPLPPVITPTLVMLAAYKVYAHRIELVWSPEAERSMQWGSDWEAVAQSLQSASVLSVLDETISGLVIPA